MKVFNFPFYPSIKGDIFYHGKINFEKKENNKLLKIDLKYEKIGALNRHINTPLQAATIQTNYLKKIIKINDNDYNTAIVDLHIITFQRVANENKVQKQKIPLTVAFHLNFQRQNSPTIAIGLIIKERSNTNSSNNLRQTKRIVIIYTNDLQLSELNKFTNIQLTISRKKSDGAEQYEIECKRPYFYSWLATYMETGPYQIIYPLMIFLPFMSFKLMSRGELEKPGLYLIRDLTLESLVGTLLFIRDKRRWIQFPYFIPSPLLASAIYNVYGKTGKSMNRLKTQKEVRESSITPINLLSSTTVSSASFVLCLDLTDFIRKTSEQLHALIKIAEEDLRRRISRTDLKEQLKKDIPLDPKSILKALTLPYFPGSVFDEYIQGIFSISSTKSTGVELRIGIGKSLWVKYSYVKPRNREKMLYNIFESIYLNDKEKKDRSRIIYRIIRSYLELLYEEIGDENTSIKVNSEYFANALSLALAELGLHAISHILMKYINREFKIPMSKMREVIILTVPSSLIRISRFYRTHRLNKIIDGFIYVVDGGIGSKIRGYTVIIIDEDHSYNRLKMSNFFRNRKEEATITQFIYTSLNEIKSDLLLPIGETEEEDPCYSLWLSHRLTYDTTFDILTASLDDKNAKEYLRELKQVLSQRMKVGDKPESVFGAFYLPISELRRIANRAGREIVLPRLSLCEEDDEDCLDRRSREIKRKVKFLLPALYNSISPPCFDCCYNCVKIKRRFCAVKNPLLEDWSLSKSVARAILKS